ncbi:CoA transferase [Achromobacter sp. GG226]|uniref:CaiB/BaiF CoA transferase family protein n=1 Tax=Verticiella alkaliphila TaxID=2779529 RepID=UPI001C0D81AF|nr:CoA transferase [Verticiella sp. GG226]MBU4611500.1 CoA transferase [Verticiella sp. GG226]
MSQWQRSATGPLAGVKVIDLTQMLAGPYCAMMLGDMGADVIKIEPINGDQTRNQGPHFPDDEAQHFGGYFQSVNRNKCSVTLDLKQPGGRDILLRLVQDADVLLENFRVGVMDRLGLGFETLREHNPRLVYGCIRGFGDPRTGESPYAEWPAFDVVAQAMGGIMGITGPDADTPVKIGPGVGDIFPAALTAFGVASALRQAEKTGRGQFVDVAMYDSILALCERIVYQHAYTGEIPRPQGTSHPLLCPFDNFPTSDGWVTIAAPRENLWRELCRLIGAPELADDPRYNSNRQRTRNAAQVRELLSAWTRQRTKQQVMQALGGFVPAGPVNDAGDIFKDPHVHARQMLVTLPHPGSEHPGVFAGVPIKLAGTPATPPRRAPLLAEHTDAVLRAHGYDETEIAAFVADGVVTISPQGD